MTVRTIAPALRLFACGLAVSAVSVSRAADPTTPPSNKQPAVDQARAEVLRALEQFREAEARLRQAENRLRELEGKPAPAAEETPTETRIITLKSTDANAAAKVLRETWGKGRIVISVDDRTNALVVRGSPLDLMSVEALLSRLDQEAKAAPPGDDLGIYRLKNADAQAVVGVLTQMYGKGKEARALIVVEPTTNALLVRARDEDRKAIESLIRYIDEEAKAAPPAQEARADVHVLRVEKTEAVALAKVLTEVFGKDRAHIVADPATNSLLVRARVEDLKQIVTLVRELDVPSKKRE
jgi:general secretion pathway protein D